MPDSESLESRTENDSIASGPLVFISHDARDAELAEAFSKLLKSVSAGMIKTFRSSDKNAGTGIDFGEEWYNRLMNQLQATTDVVCLFTERSLDRPWILFEAGVAKGKLDTAVFGVALGVPLSRVSAGPFYQFQNMDDGQDDLTKLVIQLSRRVPGLELDADVIRTQVLSFKEKEASILESLSTTGEAEVPEGVEESSIAKLMEEMKTLPSRVAERLSEDAEPNRRRRSRRTNPLIFQEIVSLSREPEDAIVMAANLVRDDIPWLHDLSMDVYRALRTGDRQLVDSERRRFMRVSEFMAHSPLSEETGARRHDIFVIVNEFERMLDYVVGRYLEAIEQPVPSRGGATRRHAATRSDAE